MTRFLAKLAGFLALALAVAVGLEGGLAASAPDEAAIKYAAAFAPGGFNGLILGSSLAEHGIDPRAIDGPGLHWYNFAFGGSGPRFERPWYELYRQRARRPDVVLLAVDWFVLSPGLGRRLEHDSAYFPWGVLAGRLAAPGARPEVLLANRLALVRAREPLQARLALVPPPDLFHKVADAYHDGYVPLSGGPAITRTPDYKPGDFDAAAAADLHALVTRLLADGTRVVLVRLPECRAVVGDHADVAARALARAGLPALPLLDYTGSAIARDRRLFIDWGHLNVRGSQLFGPLLARDLRRLGLYR